MRLLHMTDVHFYRPPTLGAALGKRALGLLNLHVRGRRSAFDADALVPRAIHDALPRDPGLFLMTGDLSALSSDAEFAAARAAFAPLLDSVPSIVVPGNHDLYTTGARRDARMERWFAPFMGGGTWDPSQRAWVGGWSGPEGAPVPWPVRFRIGAVDVIATNPCKPGLRASGAFGAGAIDRAEALVAESRDDGQFVVYLLHYPVLGPDGAPYRHDGHDLQDLSALIASLRRAPPDALLHGHLHQAFRVDLPAEGRRVPIFGCGSTSATSSLPDRAAGYYLIDVDDGVITDVLRRRFDPDSDAFVTDPERGGAP